MALRLQVKLWTVNSGFCFVTFSEHTAPVTAVSFLPTSSAAVSASLDGTVRAWDLLRYRNFRTMTTPDPVQLASLAVDPAGEVPPVPCLAEHPCKVYGCSGYRLASVFGDWRHYVFISSLAPSGHDLSRPLGTAAASARP